MAEFCFRCSSNKCLSLLISSVLDRNQTFRNAISLTVTLTSTVKPQMNDYFTGKDACQGDSGGALFTPRPLKLRRDSADRMEVIGITSFGQGTVVPNS